MPPVRDALTVDDSLYAVPFYAESSFLMYNEEILDEAGLEVPEHPTWQEIAEMAREVDDDDTTGICLRGKPGWGELFAPLTTVVQTFGGNWYDEDWNAQVDGEGFTEAVQFYTDLVADAGESDHRLLRLHRVPEPVHAGRRGVLVRTRRARQAPSNPPT